MNAPGNGPGGGGGFDPNGYRGFGYYAGAGDDPFGSGSPAEPPGSRAMLIIGIIASVIIVVGGVAIVFLVQGNGRPQATGRPGQQPIPSAESSRAAGVAPGGTGAPGASRIPPVIPGWQVATSAKGGLAYDVPPAWTVEGPGAFIGLGSAGSANALTMTGDSLYRNGFCPGHSGSTRAGAGLTAVTDPDPAKAAAELVRRAALGAYTTNGGTPPGIGYGPAESVTVGSAHGVIVTATLTVTPTSSCDSPSAVVTVLTLPGSGGCAALVAWADQGVADQATPADLRRILGTLRPAS